VTSAVRAYGGVDPQAIDHPACARRRYAYELAHAAI